MKLATILQGLGATVGVFALGFAFASLPVDTASAATAHNSCRAYTLRKGNVGYCVRMAQTLLKGPFTTQVGGFTPNLALDGDFGTLTYNAAVKFQRSQRIVDDGIVGPQTWSRLCSMGAGGGTLSHTTPSSIATYNYAFSVTC